MSSDVKDTIEVINQPINKESNKMLEEMSHLVDGEGSEGNCETDKQFSKNNMVNKASVPPLLQEESQHPSKGLELLNKVVADNDLQNSIIQDSPLAPKEMDSIITESIFNTDILSDYLTEIKQNAEKQKKKIFEAPLNKQVQGDTDKDRNGKQEEIKHNSNQHMSNEDRKIRKSTEVDDTVMRILIKKAQDEDNLFDSNIMTPKDDSNQTGLIRQTENNINNKNKNNCEDLQEQQDEQALGEKTNSLNESASTNFCYNHADLNLQSQENSQSPNIQLLQSEFIQPDSSLATTNSLCLDHNKLPQHRDNTIQRSLSYHATQGAHPASIFQNNNFSSNGQQNSDTPSPNISLFAQMSKQQSRRDMKNWAQGKTFGASQRGSSNLTNSAVLPNVGNASSNYLSQNILQKNVSSQSGYGYDDNLQSSFDDGLNNQQSAVESLSESVPVISAQPKKMINLLSNKKAIKITNTKSTELKKYNFQDDDMINFDENAYQNLSLSYNINQNIGISVKTLLSYQVNNSHNNHNNNNSINNNSQVNQRNTYSQSIQLPNSPQKTSNQTLDINLQSCNLGGSATSLITEDKKVTTTLQTDNPHDNQKQFFENQRHRTSPDNKILNAVKQVSNDSEEKAEIKKSEMIDTSQYLDFKSSTKKVIIPVLLSVKTEEQMMSFQYFEQLQQNSSQKDIHSLHQIDNQVSLSNNQSPNNRERANEAKVKLEQRTSIDSIRLKTAIDEIKEAQDDSDDNSDNQSSSCNSDNENHQYLEGQIADEDINKLDSEECKKFNNLEQENNQLNQNQDNYPDQIDQEPIRKISKKNVIMKSIATKAKKTKDIHFKKINKEEPDTSLKRINQNVHFEGSPFQQPMRFPIDLICVIDTSGSMNGEPLDLLKETLLFLVDLLQSGDRICLIQFSTNAKRLTPLLTIESKDNIETVKGEINRLIAKGGTNINQGMQLAFDVLKQRRYKNPITSVFLLSDGLNDGAENRIRDLLKQLNFYQNYTEESFTIQTFGFGKDHDPNLMDKISQLMDGNFYYIGDIHRIDECFIDALGGLFSVVSQNVSIKVQVPHEMRNRIRIVKTYGDIWHTKEHYYEYVININQLLSGVSKDYILEIELDPKIIEDSQCIQEIHSEEDILSSDHIGSYRSFDAQVKPNLVVQPGSPNITHQFPNILEMELIAKNISVNTIHQSNHKIKLEHESNKQTNTSVVQNQIFKMNESNQPSTPDLVQKESNLSSIQLQHGQSSNQLSATAFSNASVTEISSAKNVVSKFIANQNQGDRQANSENYTSPSQSECSQLSINIIPANSEEVFSLNVANLKCLAIRNQTSSPEPISDNIVKKVTLNLKNHKQIQENLVKLHYLRVKGAEGLDKCQNLALQKKFDEGSDHINKLLHELNEQPEETRKNLSKLIIDLTEAQDTLRKKVSESVGWHRMISCKRMHMEQRSTGTDLTYQNSVQKIMVQRRKSIKDQNSIQSLTETVQKIQQAIHQGAINIQPSLLNDESPEKQDKTNLSSSDSSDEDDNSSIHSSQSQENNKKLSPNKSNRRSNQIKSLTHKPTHHIKNQTEQQQQQQDMQQIDQDKNTDTFGKSNIEEIIS